jgi:spore germination cell wall hydrolase CwlJ-like protein
MIYKSKTFKLYMEVVNISRFLTKLVCLSSIALITMAICSMYITYSLGYENNEYITDGSSEITSQTSNFADIHDAGNSTKNTVIDSIIDVNVDNDTTIRLGLTKDAVSMNYTTLESSDVKDTESSVIYSDEDSISISEILSYQDIIQQEREEEAKRLAEEEARKKSIAAKTYSETTTQGGLVDIASPDSSYGNAVVSITGNDRSILEHLVMGEAGGQGFIGAALVAQCIKDMYIYGGYTSIDSLRRNCGYTGSLNNTPNQDVIDAVAYVFDQGGYAVQHRIFYFYAPALCTSKWHESQNFIIQYGGHRFFDRWS